MPGQAASRWWRTKRDHLGLFAPTRDRGLVLAWLVAGSFLALVLLKLFTRQWMVDGRTYHDVWHANPMYDLPPTTTGAYLYSPVFAQWIAPLTHLPWWLFSALWLTAAAASYLWLVRPVGWLWALPLLAVAVEDATLGNINWLLALACVLGMRWPGFWVIPLLTKITTGVGLVWFLARKDLRALLVAAATTTAAIGLSWLLAPGLWSEWLAFLWSNRSQDPLLLPRLTFAIGVVWYAARKDRAWLIPVAMFLATPVLVVYGLGILAAIPRLLSPEAQARARAPFGPLSAFTRRVLDLPPRDGTATGA